MANWLTKMLPFGKARAAEGAYRPGPYFLSDGFLSAKAGKFLNWWQMGYSLQPYGDGNSMCEACQSAYAQTVAMCPGAHWRKLPDNGRERVNSPLSRILKRPNDYQSISDFMMNITRKLYSKGEVFAYAPRNGRFEIAELHMMQYGRPLVGTDGSVFYGLAGNDIAERRYDLTQPVPARDVLHIRLHTPRHPLVGVSPLMAAILELELSGAALSQQTVFYLNQARPSFTLETDQQLSAEETTALRKRWEEQTTGENAGGTPILAWGLKAKQVSQSAKDGELADILKLTQQNIALAYRMPLQILGLGGTNFGSTELLMQSWIASGLGFVLNHIEEALGNLFGLGGYPDEYVEFDTNALLRSAFKDRIEGYARGVISGIFAPDEARDEFDLPKVKGGFGVEPRVQQQVVPLSWAGFTELPTSTPPAPKDPPQDPPPDSGRALTHTLQALAEQTGALTDVLSRALERAQEKQELPPPPAALTDQRQEPETDGEDDTFEDAEGAAFVSSTLGRMIDARISGDATSNL